MIPGMDSLMKSSIGIVIIITYVRVVKPWQILLALGTQELITMLLDSVKTVGKCFVHDGRPHNFIIDLFGMNVPKLFGLPAVTDVQGHAEAVEVQNEFTSFFY